MDDNISEVKKTVSKRSLTPQEQSAIARMKQKRIRMDSVFRASENAEQDAIELAVDTNLERSEACDLFESNILEATGAANSLIGIQFLSNVGQAIVPAKAKGKEKAYHLNTIAHAMHSLHPQDEYEGQLVAQLVVLHEHAMDWLGRAHRTKRVDFANVYLNGASKLLTRHHETLEALLKYRRKGEQRVHVEHVHVHGGGQAIVGHVITGAG